MKKFFLALAAWGAISSVATAGNWSVVVDGVRYEQQKVDLHMGEVLKIGKTCTVTPQGFHKTETCTWRHVIRSTEEGITVHDNDSTTRTSVRGELFAGIVSICMMVIAMAVITRSIFASTCFSAVAAPSATLASFLLYTNATIAISIFAALCAAYALVLVSLIAPCDVEYKKKKFYAVASVHISMTVVALVLTMW